LKLFRRLALDDAARQSALREVRLIASVSHPSVVQFKDYGWDAGRLYFVMPFYRGETLRARLARGPLSRLEAKAIFVPLARALATMHATGVRHQDIKPENIFLARPHVDEDVLPVLIDLGVAVKDAENVLAGTPNYFAPEVAARFAREPDPPPVTGKADVFSLALVLRNALEPERDEGIVAGAVDAFVRTRARKAPPPPRRRDLAYLGSAFSRWLALAPDDRPSAEDLARQLSLLSRPEERRARTTATLRWAVPIVVTFAGLFTAAAFALAREADLQRNQAALALQEADAERHKAAEATQRAANVGEDLAKAEAKGRSLEADKVKLEEEYQKSTMTRKDLAERLAQIEGELGQLRTQRDEELAQAALQLKEIKADRDILKTFDEASRAGLAGEKKHSAELADRISKLEADMDKTRRERDEARTRASEAEDKIAALRTSLGPVPKPTATTPGAAPAGAAPPVGPPAAPPPRVNQ
jgi:eukaryotic-like serine/threonine-protein kinase